MHLKRIVAKLESSSVMRAPPEPVYSEEDLAIMQRIVERTYADPVRYAARIALLERCAMIAEEAPELTPVGRRSAAGSG